MIDLRTVPFEPRRNGKNTTPVPRPAYASQTTEIVTFVLKDIKFPKTPNPENAFTIGRAVLQSDSQHDVQMRRVRQIEVTVKGQIPGAKTGWNFTGSAQWKENREWGEWEMLVENVAPAQLSTIDGLRDFLRDIPGLSRASVEKIISAYGTDAVGLLDADATTALANIGIAKKQVKSLVSAWPDKRSEYEMFALLSLGGVQDPFRGKIINLYGKDVGASKKAILADPYRPMRELEGFSFKMNDKLAMVCGLAEDAAARIAAAMSFVAWQSAQWGHCYTMLPAVLDSTAKEIGIADLREQWDSRALATHAEVVRALKIDNGQVWPRRLWDAEVNFAARLGMLLSAKPLIEQDAADGALDQVLRLQQAQAGTHHIEMSEEQAGFLQHVWTRQVVSILTGYAGTGKTTTVKTMLTVFETLRRTNQSLQKMSLHIVAPTGKAARVIATATGREATTVHKLLNYAVDGRPEYNEENQLPAAVYVIDETSMLDIQLGTALLMAIPTGSYVIFLGDIAQLPPVGPGYPLMSMIVSGRVPTYRLTQVFRNAGGILQLAHAVREQDDSIMPKLTIFDDVHIITTGSAEYMRKYVLRTAETHSGLDEGIRFIGYSWKNPAGVDDMNQVIIGHRFGQQRGPTFESKGFRFAVGMVCLWLQNVRDGDGKMKIANGQELTISKIEYGVPQAEGKEIECQITARTTDDRGRPVDLEFEKKEWEAKPAYACTGHKMQGSGVDEVVIVVRPNDRITVAWLYTQLTRPRKRMTILIDSVERMFNLPSYDMQRRSTLRERLVAQLPELREQ